MVDATAVLIAMIGATPPTLVAVVSWRLGKRNEQSLRKVSRDVVGVHRQVHNAHTETGLRDDVDGIRDDVRSLSSRVESGFADLRSDVARLRQDDITQRQDGMTLRRALDLAVEERDRRLASLEEALREVLGRLRRDPS